MLGATRSEQAWVSALWGRYEELWLVEKHDCEMQGQRYHKTCQECNCRYMQSSRSLIINVTSYPRCKPCYEQGPDGTDRWDQATYEITLRAFTEGPPKKRNPTMRAARWVKTCRSLYIPSFPDPGQNSQPAKANDDDESSRHNIWDRHHTPPLQGGNEHSVYSREL